MSAIDEIRRDLEAARADQIAAREGGTQAEFDRRPPGEVSDDEQRWPIVEVLWHIGQVEDRFRRAIDQGLDGRPVVADPTRPRPAHLTTLALLREWLDQSRRPTESLLRRMTDAALDVEITRADGSTRTPRRYLAIIANHDHEHAAQVRALRAVESLPAGGEV